MKRFPEESIDLIYIDPPFFSKRDYYTVWNGRRVQAYTDIWEDGMPGYLVWLNARLLEMKRLLKKSSSIYVHLDWHASHYVKVELDKIFGYDNFRNEIIWHYDYGARSKTTFGSKHDNLFWYSKTNEWKFNKDDVLVPFASKMTEWRYTKGGQKGKPMPSGKVPSDVWDIKINAMSNERIGYPTQKPEVLLERIILASSNPSDVVADFFCGGGTTPAVAQRLGRRWIACDMSRVACAIARRRLAVTKFKRHKGIFRSLFIIVLLHSILSLLRPLRYVLKKT